MAYADVRAIMDSELRARLKAAMPMQEQGQKEFQAADRHRHRAGHRLRRRRRCRPAVEKPAPLVVARGRFNDTQLESLIREHGGTVEEYKGKRLVNASARAERPSGSHRSPTQSGSVTLAFLEPGLIAFGDATAVKTAIDAQLAAHSITSNSEMMELVADIGQSNNAWAVGRFDVLAAHAQAARTDSAQLPPVKWFAAAGHVDGGVSGNLRAEARDDQAAENLRDVVRGFLALARMQAQADPRRPRSSNRCSSPARARRWRSRSPSRPKMLQMIPKAARSPGRSASKRT